MHFNQMDVKEIKLMNVCLHFWTEICADNGEISSSRSFNIYQPQPSGYPTNYTEKQ